jgi:hypothetical protein
MDYMLCLPPPVHPRARQSHSLKFENSLLTSKSSVTNLKTMNQNCDRERKTFQEGKREFFPSKKILETRLADGKYSRRRPHEPS